jgi:hypothetical protein
MSKRKKIHHRVIGHDGPPCPRCSQPTEIREHQRITDKHTKRQPFYYSRWFYCTNSDCITNLIMPDEFRVWNEHPAKWMRRWMERKGIGPTDSAEPEPEARFSDIALEILDDTKPPWE